MRVMSYNIWDGGGGRLPLIRDITSAHAPDAVALVEATNRSKAEWLAHELGMELIFGEANNGYHIAWLCRLPVRRVVNHRAPVFSKAVLEIEAGWSRASLRLFATHLASRHDGGEERVTQEMRAIVDILRAPGDLPHILLGDFNTLHPADILDPPQTLPPDMEERAQREYAKPRLAIPLLLQAGYTDCYRALHPAETGYTYRSDAPLARIDYIFASLEMARRLRACDHMVGDLAAKASDHLPLWADFS